VLVADSRLAVEWLRWTPKFKGLDQITDIAGISIRVVLSLGFDFVLHDAKGL